MCYKRGLGMIRAPSTDRWWGSVETRTEHFGRHARSYLSLGHFDVGGNEQLKDQPGGALLLPVLRIALSVFRLRQLRAEWLSSRNLSW